MNALARQTENVEKLVDDFFNSRFMMNHPVDYLINTPKYPPHNIVKDGDDRILEYALAGFSKDDIKVEFDGSQLTIKAEKEKTFPEDEREFITRGISQRSLDRSWTVGSDFEVQEPVFKDGILSIRFKSVKEAPKQLTIKSK